MKQDAPLPKVPIIGGGGRKKWNKVLGGMPSRIVCRIFEIRFPPPPGGGRGASSTLFQMISFEGKVQNFPGTFNIRPNNGSSNPRLFPPMGGFSSWSHIKSPPNGCAPFYLGTTPIECAPLGGPVFPPWNSEDCAPLHWDLASALFRLFGRFLGHFATCD